MQNKKKASLAIALALLSTASLAEKSDEHSGYTVTPYIGYIFSADIEDASGSELGVSDDPSFGVAVSWHDSPTGLGQVFVNYVSHDFDNNANNSNEDLNVLYTHFSGVALIEHGPYTSTFEIGIGGAYMDSNYESAVYPSATIAIGTRYDISPTLTLATDIRAYGTLTDEDDELFCDEGTCVADFGAAVYYDTAISVGLTFKF